MVYTVVYTHILIQDTGELNQTVPKMPEVTNKDPPNQLKKVIASAPSDSVTVYVYIFEKTVPFVPLNLLQNTITFIGFVSELVSFCFRCQLLFHIQRLDNQHNLLSCRCRRRPWQRRRRPWQPLCCLYNSTL